MSGRVSRALVAKADNLYKFVLRFAEDKILLLLIGEADKVVVILLTVTTCCVVIFFLFRYKVAFVVLSAPV